MHPPPILIMDSVGPVIGALVFVVIMSLVSEPARRAINAMIVAGASGAYVSGGGFGLAWLLHSCWHIVHHLWGNPIWPFMPTSSFGCLIFDALIAVWFLAGTPSLVDRVGARNAAVE
jgi:uncharacterized protein DUF6010